MVPFVVEVGPDVIDDHRQRLARTRWPDELPGVGWDCGTPLRYLQELCHYWRVDFDWAAFVDRRNAFPQYVTTIDGQRIHFIHAPSREPNARPLLMTHGWPGSVAEFHAVLGPLTDPTAYGGDEADAFSVVAPSLPGYGFSGPTTGHGWNVDRVASTFAELMSRLEYEHFFAQGGDWGSAVTSSIGSQFPDRVAAIHLNLVAVPPPDPQNPTEGLSESDLALLDANARFLAHETGYQAIQSTKPQTLSYGLNDSPAGLAGWIVEKFRTWSDGDGSLEQTFSKDQILDNISIYWVTQTINSSARLYYETLGPGQPHPLGGVQVPVGAASYPGEIYRSPKRWAEAAFNLVYWSEPPRGGHFAAMEVPELFVDDLRSFFRTQSLPSAADHVRPV